MNRPGQAVFPAALGPSRSQAGAYALTLRAEGDLLLPLLIDRAEAVVVTHLLAGLDPPRPLAVAVLEAVLALAGQRPAAVWLEASPAGCIAQVTLAPSAPAGEATFGVSAGTGVAVALQTACPLFAAPDLLRQAGLRLHVLAAESLPTPLASLTDSELRHWEQQAAAAGDFAGAAAVQHELQSRH